MDLNIDNTSQIKTIVNITNKKHFLENLKNILMDLFLISYIRNLIF